MKSSDHACQCGLSIADTARQAQDEFKANYLEKDKCLITALIKNRMEGVMIEMTILTRLDLTVEEFQLYSEELKLAVGADESLFNRATQLILTSTTVQGTA